MAMGRKISGRGKMKSKILVLVVVCALFALSPDLMAKERRGAQLVITKTDGQKMRHELIAVKQTSLLLLDSESAIESSVSVDEIRSIRRVRKPNFLFGILAGTIAGIFAGRVQADYSEPAEGMMVGTAVGISTAVAVGLMFGFDENIMIEGRSPDEIKEILEGLRHQARFPEAQ